MYNGDFIGFLNHFKHFIIIIIIYLLRNTTHLGLVLRRIF